MFIHGLREVDGPQCVGNGSSARCRPESPIAMCQTAPWLHGVSACCQITNVIGTPLVHRLRCAVSPKVTARSSMY